MSVHQEKYCPRCNNRFECKVDNIAECQCAAISLTAEERAFIEKDYTDCLCYNCLLQIKQEYTLLQQKPD